MRESAAACILPTRRSSRREIAELTPHEIATDIEKRGKKEKDTKPSIVVIQGPKSGKPTDLDHKVTVARSWEILLNVPLVLAKAKDAKHGASAAVKEPSSPPESCMSKLMVLQRR